MCGDDAGVATDCHDYFFGESWQPSIITVGAQLITLSMSDEPKRE
jgi:hypothetical protein